MNNETDTKMKVVVEIKHVYGVKKVYPVNDTAKAFARLTETTTLTDRALREIQNLGYAVVIKEQKL